ncbi:MAG: hypothetical protein JXA15_05890 [Spirochaetales bacterium]|nr:hypothetical protein [Spirochaetales bacterium]
MKAFFTLLALETRVLARGGFPVVILVVLAASALSVHALRAVDAAADAASPAGLAGPERLEAGPWTFTVIRAAARPALHERMVTTLLVYEVLILGFLFVAVGLFQQFEEGSLRAYRLSPGGQARWMGAKLLVWTVAGVAYGLAFLAASFELPAWRALPGVVALSALGSLLMTTLGLLLASFSRNLSQWFPPAVGLLALNMAPAALAESWPEARWFAPGGAALAGFEALLGQGDAKPLGAAFAWLGAALALALPLSWLALRARVFKEGGR